MAFKWALYFELLAEELGRKNKSVQLDITALEQSWDRFRNIDYPLATTPLVLNPDWERNHRAQMHCYLCLLEKTVQLCVEHAEISEYLGHSAIDRQFVLTPRRTDRYIEICRVDGYIDRSNGTLKILEHNSDSPAGIVFTPRLNALVLDIWRSFGLLELDKYLGAEQFDDPLRTQRHFESFVDARTPGLAILQEAGKSNVESIEMERSFTASGLPTRVVDPGEVTTQASGASANGQGISVIWNKINTVGWRDYLERNSSQVNKWLALQNDERICHLNHFGARLVAENKRCLSLLQEPRFEALFTDDERQLVKHMLPWARKFEPGKRVAWKDNEIDMQTLATTHREQLVIKEPYDIRGDGVTVGIDCSPIEWENKVQRAFEQRLVLQEYVAPLQMPVCHTHHWSRQQISNLSLDTFMFSGDVVGYGAKASTKHKVNLFKGGQKIAVLQGT